MKTENAVVEKSYAFALRIVKMYKFMIKEKHEWVLAKQVLRSGTSIGANIEEAMGAQSRKDFIGKIYIAYKETRETAYWLTLLKDAEYLDEVHYSLIYPDCRDLQNLLASILLTTKRNMESS